MKSFATLITAGIAVVVAGIIGMVVVSANPSPGPDLGGPVNEIGPSSGSSPAAPPAPADAPTPAASATPPMTTAPAPPSPNRPGADGGNPVDSPPTERP